MKNAAQKKMIFLFRFCLLNCVLTGLLFSCGEGIRLCPFPATEIQASNHTLANLETEIPYQFNAHRFEENQGHQRLKSQTDNLRHFWKNFDILINPADFAAAATNGNRKFSFREIFRLPSFSRSGKSRAPPLMA